MIRSRRSSSARPQAVELLLVGGRPIVVGGELRTADEAQVAAEIARASRRLAAKAEARR